MVGSIFCAAFSLLFLSLLIPSSAARASIAVVSSQSPNLPLFKEAPVFRNGLECLPLANPNDDEELCEESMSATHIAMTLDFSYLRGSMAAILSIVQHASCPENLVFHLLSSTSERELAHLVKSTFPYLKFKVYHFDEGHVRSKISSSIRQALEQPLNYARIYIADVLPSCIKRVIYLDSDVVVVDDIVKLWGKRLNSHPIGAPEYCNANFTKYFTDEFWLDGRLNATFGGRKPCYFNTGVMVMDWERWWGAGYTRAIVGWMGVQKAKRIYELGSLPPFLLVFGGNVEAIEHKWNQHGLGGDNIEGRCRLLHPGPVSLLHWSGKGKPWSRLDSRKPCPLDTLWAPYDLHTTSSIS